MPQSAHATQHHPPYQPPPQPPHVDVMRLPVVPVVPPPSAQGPRWEYRRVIHALSDSALPDDTALTALGDEGWELVAVVTTKRQAHFYFRRLRT